MPAPEHPHRHYFIPPLFMILITPGAASSLQLPTVSTYCASVVSHCEVTWLSKCDHHHLTIQLRALPSSAASDTRTSRAVPTYWVDHISAEVGDRRGVARVCLRQGGIRDGNIMTRLDMAALEAGHCQFRCCPGKVGDLDVAKLKLRRGAVASRAREGGALRDAKRRPADTSTTQVGESHVGGVWSSVNICGPDRVLHCFSTASLTSYSATAAIRWITNLLAGPGLEVYLHRVSKIYQSHTTPALVHTACRVF